MLGGDIPPGSTEGWVGIPPPQRTRLEIERNAFDLPGPDNLILHNIDDYYRNIHPPPPHPMRGEGAWGGGWGMDIAIGVINVMPYANC